MQIIRKRKKGDEMAKSKEGVELKFSIISKDANAALKEIANSTKIVSKELNLTDTVLKGTGASVSDYEKKLDLLNTQQDAIKRKIEITNKAYEEARKLLGENSTEAQKWQTKLIEQQTELEKVKNKISSTNTELENFKDGVEDAGEKTSVFGDVLKANLASDVIIGGIKSLASAIGGLVKNGISKVIDLGTSFEQASNQMQASLGLSTTAAEEYDTVLKDMYAANYGESFEDIATSISTVQQVLGALDTSEIQNITENAMTLRDVFDVDINESIRATQAMMKNFGITSDEAFNLMTQGFQNGLNYSGELIDNVNEYSVQFQKLGLSAEDMFNIFQAGSDAGAWNLDKIGDAIKEFSIRAIDGSNTTIDGFKRLGMSADDMADKFAAGGSTARDAFYEVIDAIAAMEDPVEQSIVGVDLFGTMWEDLGPQVVTQLGSIRDAYDGAANSMAKMQEVKYDDFGSAIEGIGRILETKLILPIGERLIPILEELSNQFLTFIDSPEGEEFLNNIVDGVTSLINSVVNLVQFLVDNWEFISAIAITIGAIATAIGLVNAAMAIFSIVSSPITWIILGIIAAIAAIIAIIVLLKENWDAIWNWIVGVFEGVGEALGNTWNAICDAFDAAGTWIGDVCKSIGDFFANLGKGIADAIMSIINWFASLPGKAVEMAQGIFNAVASLPGKMLDIGKNIVTGIWDGISGAAGWLFDQVGNFCSSIWEGITGFFGIHSPSTLMKETVGKNIGYGIGDGVIDSIGYVENAMADLGESAINSISATDLIINATTEGLDNSNPTPLYLTIENFNNNREQDIEELIEEIEFYRKTKEVTG